MYEAYKSAFKYSNRPRQACLVTILLVIVMLICFVQNKFMTEKEANK